MATGKENLTWTDPEVELLLKVTLNYKTTKAAENVDWESCQSKYSDITAAFREQYQTGEAFSRDFPHDPSSISKGQITAKLKAIRTKFRKAVDAGRTSGFGRVVYVFFHICQNIWGGSPATDALPFGFESGDLIEEAPNTSDASSSTAPVSPAPSMEMTQSEEINRRRSLLQEKLNNHRTDRLKRKAPIDPATQQDLHLKKRLVDLIEDSEKHCRQELKDLNYNIRMVMTRGFDLLERSLAEQQPPPAPPAHAQHPYAHHGPSPSFMSTPRPQSSRTSPAHASHSFTSAHSQSYTSAQPTHNTTLCSSNPRPRARADAGYSYRRALDLEDDEDLYDEDQ